MVLPALGRFVEAMLGSAPPDPGGLCEHMVECGTGLFGAAAQVASQLERYAEVGVGHGAFISRFGGMAADAAERSLRQLAPVHG